MDSEGEHRFTRRGLKESQNISDTENTPERKDTENGTHTPTENKSTTIKQSKTEAASIKSLNSQLKAAKTEIETINTKANKYWQLLDGKNKELVKLHDDHAKALETIKTQKARLDLITQKTTTDNTQELADARQEIAELTEKLNEKSDLQKQYDASQQTIDKLENEIKNTEKENDDLRDIIADLKEDIKDNEI